MYPANKLFSGSLVALVTPMLVDGKIDYDCLCRLIDWHIASGTQGLVIMGTTGESSLVSVEEHLAIVKAAISHTKERIPVIAGCSSASTFKAVELVKNLNELGPDGYLCVAPYYVKPSQSGMIAHFKAVADTAKSPLILYNVPTRTACDLTNESVVELARHPNIIGIKDAVGDIARAQSLFGSLGETFNFLSGDDASAYDYILKGGHGVISVTANVAPEIMSKWCHLLLQQNVAEQKKSQAHKLFDQLMPLHQQLFVEGNPIPVKWALTQMNKISTGIRLPLTQPSQQSQKKIAEALEKSVRFQALE